jgi:hypothetical protein
MRWGFLFKCVMSKSYTDKDIVRKWARKCSITGEGMNEGWVWGDGAFYIKHKKDVIDEIRHRDESLDLDLNYSKMSDDELLELYYDKGVLYWTEWYDDEYILYGEMSDGSLIELEIEL